MYTHSPGLYFVAVLSKPAYVVKSEREVKDMGENLGKLLDEISCL